MSSHCTVNRLVPWRVKDFASCFYACRFPLEEEREKLDFGSKGLSKMRKVSRKRKILKKTRDEDGKKAESSAGNNKSNSGGVRGSKESAVADSSWPHFEEEDYIVFCFKEDGEIDMINDGKKISEEHVDDNKDKYDKGKTLKSIDIQVNGGVDKKDTEWPPDDEQRAYRVDSFESCDSNLSDASTSSFAFPVLGVEWIGSPVQMPKSEKQWDGSVNFQCCRF